MSKALELADKLEKLTESGLWYDGKPAAAELRRLAAVEAERDALKAELERIKSLEPVAWRWSVKKLSGVEWRYTLHKTKPESEPLYTLEKP